MAFFNPTQGFNSINNNLPLFRPKGNTEVLASIYDLFNKPLEREKALFELENAKRNQPLIDELLQLQATKEAVGITNKILENDQLAFMNEQAPDILKRMEEILSGKKSPSSDTSFTNIIGNRSPKTAKQANTVATTTPNTTNAVEEALQQPNNVKNDVILSPEAQMYQFLMNTPTKSELNKADKLFENTQRTLDPDDSLGTVADTIEKYSELAKYSPFNLWGDKTTQYKAPEHYYEPEVQRKLDSSSAAISASKTALDDAKAVWSLNSQADSTARKTYINEVSNIKNTLFGTEGKSNNAEQDVTAFIVKAAGIDEHFLNKIQDPKAKQALIEYIVNVKPENKRGDIVKYAKKLEGVLGNADMDILLNIAEMSKAVHKVTKGDSNSISRLGSFKEGIFIPTSENLDKIYEHYHKNMIKYQNDVKQSYN